MGKGRTESGNSRKRGGIATPAMKRTYFATGWSSTASMLALAATLLVSGCSKQAPPQATAAPQQYPGTPQNSPGNQAAPNQVAPNAAGQQAINPGAASPVQQPGPQQQASGGYAAQPAPYAPAAPASFTIPAGTHIRVTTREELGSKSSQPGQSFTATVASPVTVRGVTLIRAGSPATGTVIDAKSLGKFKGQATLAIRLDSVRSEGRTYQVASSTIDRVEKGKGKRTAVLAGGGGGLGALIGGLAGGGKGALIGGLAGAGGGTAGAAFTGNKEILIPAETPLTFRLERAVTVGR